MPPTTILSWKPNAIPGMIMLSGCSTWLCQAWTALLKKMIPIFHMTWSRHQALWGRWVHLKILLSVQIYIQPAWMYELFNSVVMLHNMGPESLTSMSCNKYLLQVMYIQVAWVLLEIPTRFNKPCSDVHGQQQVFTSQQQVFTFFPIQGLGHLASVPPPAGSSEDIFLAEIEEREEWGREGGMERGGDGDRAWSLASKLAHAHFYHMPLAKASHKLTPVSEY